MIATTAQSNYELERNKPMPNRLHGLIQGNLSHLFRIYYKKQYQSISELSLATKPGSTPDICIFPKKILDRKEIEAKETEAPLTTIEIQSPSQSIEELEAKAWDLYFPMGVKSAWIVIPALKAVKVIFPNAPELVFYKGKVKDSVTNIELELKDIFEDVI